MFIVCLPKANSAMQMPKLNLWRQQAINPVHQVCGEYPLILNTGRIRDQWHSMSRTGLSANLSTHRAEPYCEIHPQDALKFGVKDGELVEVKSNWGLCILRAQVKRQYTPWTSFCAY